MTSPNQIEQHILVHRHSAERSEKQIEYALDESTTNVFLNSRKNNFLYTSLMMVVTLCIQSMDTLYYPHIK